MKKLNFFLIAAALVFASHVFASHVFAQDMKPPSPIDSPLLNSMSGTWVSNPYTMMGTTMTDEVTQKMVLNGQFFQINVRSVGTDGFVYEALIMVAPLADGTIEGWGFDVFGDKSITTYTGTWKDNTVYVFGKGNWGTESRNISMQGDIMLQNVIWKMKGSDGKEMTTTVPITYNKK